MQFAHGGGSGLPGRVGDADQGDCPAVDGGDDDGAAGSSKLLAPTGQAPEADPSVRRLLPA
ncbi:hypothetical protein ACE1OC_37105 [Streptomyces sp. DSM 116496]|uniref:hypothetical protein n=1 Tax=Streptomyces stoeckheimensis TaxID=3344656 RepID=UPI0038B2C44A